MRAVNSAIIRKFALLSERIKPVLGGFRSTGIQGKNHEVGLRIEIKGITSGVRDGKI